MSLPTTLEALQSTLAAEHAAIWLYGLLGGQAGRLAHSGLAGSDLADRVEEAYTVHAGRRDELAGMVRDLGVEPEPSEVAYQVPADLAGSRGVSAAARTLEQRSCAVYADLVAAATGDQRAWAVAALTDAAVRSLAFGGRAQSFPGLTELADR